jgi:hypothetical protein
MRLAPVPALSREIETINDGLKAWILAQRIEVGIDLDPSQAAVANFPRAVEGGKRALRVSKLGVYFRILVARGVAKLLTKGAHGPIDSGLVPAVRGQEDVAHRMPLHSKIVSRFDDPIECEQAPAELVRPPKHARRCSLEGFAEIDRFFQGPIGIDHRWSCGGY